MQVEISVEKARERFQAGSYELLGCETEEDREFMIEAARQVVEAVHICPKQIYLEHRQGAITSFLVDVGSDEPVILIINTFNFTGERNWVIMLSDSTSVMQHGRQMSAPLKSPADLLDGLDYKENELEYLLGPRQAAVFRGVVRGDYDW